MRVSLVLHLGPACFMTWLNTYLCLTYKAVASHRISAIWSEVWLGEKANSFFSAHSTLDGCFTHHKTLRVFIKRRLYSGKKKWGSLACLDICRKMPLNLAIKSQIKVMVIDNISLTSNLCQSAHPLSSSTRSHSLNHHALFFFHISFLLPVSRKYFISFKWNFRLKIYLFYSFT